MRTNLFEEYFAAVAAERAAWDMVRDRLPGTHDFDLQNWEAWRAAVQRSEQARRAMMQAVARKHFSI